jgi:GNAT superfamily N-acetyltransferase
MPPRFEYLLRLTGAPAHEHPADQPGALRHPESGDHQALAALLLDAYHGTIDDEGATIDDARAEISSFFAGADLPPLAGCSWVYLDGAQLAAACLAAVWPQRQCPIISYVFTAAAWKGRGLARMLAAKSLASLRAAGYPEVRAVITAGNTPSERLFTGLSFTRLG